MLLRVVYWFKVLYYEVLIRDNLLNRSAANVRPMCRLDIPADMQCRCNVR